MSRLPHVRPAYPIRTPPLVALPDRTIRTLDPKEAICPCMRAMAPEPIAIVAITAPTPIIIPSMVKAERRAFRPIRFYRQAKDQNKLHPGTLCPNPVIDSNPQPPA
jgi:hypothetical protein